jgi:hypothetical protein
MSRYSRLFKLEDSLPDDGGQRVPIDRWPVISVATSAHLGTVISNYGGDRGETEYFPVKMDGTIIPGIFRARFVAAMAVYSHSEGAQ